VSPANQGFWNGATPPIGDKIVEAERRGQKIKKKLDIDAVEAETVKLIFRLHLDGDGSTGPLGVKETTKWLNSHGYPPIPVTHELISVFVKSRESRQLFA
jgi:site-specific DNA recombinase